jgi:hypothetical protein
MILLRALGAAALLVAADAMAQAEAESAAPVTDQAAHKFNDIERGLFVAGEGGALLLFSPKGCNTGFAPGRVGGLVIGGELGERIAIGVALLGTASDAPSTFGGDACGNGGPSGGFSSLTVGASLRVNLYAPKSEDGNERTWLYVRALAGYALLQPGGLFSSNDILVMVGPGVDFITHLRHFSIGLEADFVFGVSHLQAGVVVAPHLKYSF